MSQEVLLEEPQSPRHSLKLSCTAEWPGGSHFQVKRLRQQLGHGKKKKKALERLLKGARGRVCSDEMETELSAIKQSSPSGGNRAQLITRLIALPPRSMVVAASCCGGPFSAEGTGSLVTMVGTMNETNFLRELVPQECQNHR